MKKFDHDLAHWHAHFLDGLDRRGAAAIPLAEPAALAERRMRQAQLLFLGSGALGAAALQALSELPLKCLRVQGLRAGDVLPLSKQNKAGPSPLCERLELVSRPFEPHLTTLQLRGIDAIVIALSRPHPALLLEINRMAVRHGLPICKVGMNGSVVELGPTVIPGVGACLSCTETRLAANVAKPDIWLAQRQFWDLNPDFELAGRDAGAERQAALWLAAETERLLGGARPLLAASRLCRQDLAYRQDSEHFVSYYEWCPVCRIGLGPHRHTPAFQDFIGAQRQRLADAQALTEEQT